jgi:hypothetical protein
LNAASQFRADCAVKLLNKRSYAFGRSELSCPSIDSLISAFNVIHFGDLRLSDILVDENTRRFSPAPASVDNVLLANRPIRKCRSQPACAGRGIDLAGGGRGVSFSLKVPVIASINRENRCHPLTRVALAFDSTAVTMNLANFGKWICMVEKYAH